MNEYMKEAIELSKINLQTNEGGPFGAVIVRNNEIVGKGKNNVLVNNDPTAHAEISAIRDACQNLKTYDLSGCILYTSCYPCPMCLSAIIWSNIKTIYYGNTKDDAANIGFRDDFIYNFFDMLKNKESNKILEMQQINREDSIKVFEDFKNKKDKIIY